MRRLRHGVAHAAGRADGEVEPRVMVHLQASADAMAGFADEMGDRSAKLHFGRRVRPVAALVLQPLEL